ncbi:lectin c-type domain-containing protein [Phthorimaea operculella]|nr:lectin c-type domain-containing protein [Phthorimaea operculella]
MKSYLLFLALAYHIDFIVGRYRQYRTDYTYNEELQGWTKFHKVPEEWEEARNRCFFEGSILATPMSCEFTKMMMDAMVCNSAEKIFTGMSAIYSDGDFYSVEGDPLREMTNPWAPGQPNNYNNQQCIAMYANGYISDEDCTDKLPYMCFRKEPENPPHVRECGTIDPEYKMNDYTQHCYKFHNFGQTWSDAFKTCSAEGGYLAIINSEEERIVLENLMMDYPNETIKTNSDCKDDVFIGFYDWSENSEFMTVHGETLKEAGYEKWAKGTPNNLAPGQSCGAVRRNGLLNDMFCNELLAFICEMEPWHLQEI